MEKNQKIIFLRICKLIFLIYFFLKKKKINQKESRNKKT